MKNTFRNSRFDDCPEDDGDYPDSYCTIPAELPKSRSVGLFGGLNPDVSPGIVNAMLSLYRSEKDRIDEMSSLEDVTPAELLYKPIDFYVCTGGGNVEDLYAVYDTMEHVQKQGCPIRTFGLGHVKSAGVPLLAGGTAGERYAGKRCRFMLHSVGGVGTGNLTDVKLDVKELEWAQECYLEILIERTKLTRRRLLRILKSNSNHYFDANLALEYGIIDKIL